jgi:hypothetical protein
MERPSRRRGGLSIFSELIRTAMASSPAPSGCWSSLVPHFVQRSLGSGKEPIGIGASHLANIVRRQFGQRNKKNDEYQRPHIENATGAVHQCRPREITKQSTKNTATDDITP